MAKLSREAIIEKIERYIYVNGIGAITAIQMNEILRDIADSYVNIELDSELDLASVLMRGNLTNGSDIILSTGDKLVDEDGKGSLNLKIESTVEITPEVYIPVTTSWFGKFDETNPANSVGFGISTVEAGILGPDEVNFLQLATTDAIQIVSLADGSYDGFILTVDERGLVKPVDPSVFNTSDLQTVLSQGNETNGNNILLSTGDKLTNSTETGQIFFSGVGDNTLSLLASDIELGASTINFISAEYLKIASGDYMVIGDNITNYISNSTGGGFGYYGTHNFYTRPKLFSGLEVNSIYNSTDNTMNMYFEDTNSFTSKPFNVYATLNVFSGSNSKIIVDEEKVHLEGTSISMESSDQLNLSSTQDITISAQNELKVHDLSIYENNAAAIAGGLGIDSIYKTSSGDVRIVGEETDCGEKTIQIQTQFNFEKKTFIPRPPESPYWIFQINSFTSLSLEDDEASFELTFNYGTLPYEVNLFETMVSTPEQLAEFMLTLDVSEPLGTSIELDGEFPNRIKVVCTPEQAYSGDDFIHFFAVNGAEINVELIDYYEGINDGEEHEYNEELLLATVDLIPDKFNEFEVIVKTKTIFEEEGNLLSLNFIKAKTIYFGNGSIFFDNQNNQTVRTPFSEIPLNELVGSNSLYYDYFNYQCGYTIYPYCFADEDPTKLNIVLRIVSSEIRDYPDFDIDVKITQKYE